ncbi:MAG: hypothetical protein J6X44_09300 [Thermoguttaceae bacterium]|nr:hypothetical protein [Thermoguttaceae bacterium]
MTHDDKADECFENAYLLSRLKDICSDEFSLFWGRGWSCRDENAYLRELLDWDRSPMSYVQAWLRGDRPVLDTRSSSDEEISRALKLLVEELHYLNHAFLYTDHLSDRRLYQLIVREVLSSELKKLSRPRGPVYWNFCSYTEDSDYDGDEEEETSADVDDCAREQNWLIYYATDRERRRWFLEHGAALPPKKVPLHPRPYIPEKVDFH